MSSAFIIILSGQGMVERKLVDQRCWEWLWCTNKFTDDMVREFRVYYGRERIGFTEAYDLFRTNSAPGQEFQRMRAQLLAPSLFKNHFRCGGPNVTDHEIKKFVARHGLWQWNEYMAHV